LLNEPHWPCDPALQRRVSRRYSLPDSLISKTLPKSGPCRRWLLRGSSDSNVSQQGKNSLLRLPIRLLRLEVQYSLCFSQDLPLLQRANS
jgi:hypothetical protein